MCTSSFQGIKSILPLVEKEPSGTRLNSDPEEVVEHTKILHSKFQSKEGDDVTK